MYALWNMLEEAKNYHVVDLSHEMSNESPYWSGIPEGSVELGKVLFDWGNPMLECRIQSFRFPGQFGTHIDFPAHFDKNGAFAQNFAPAAYPLCVIDITEKVKACPTYCVTVEDSEAYEEKYGAIPEGAFVALRTDWSKNWPDMEKMSGLAADGSENFPGWSLEAIRYIYEVRHAAANGHETLDTDGSAECAKRGDLACERYVLEHGKIQVEVLKNLDLVPEKGAVILLFWPNFRDANGLPCRAAAVIES